MESVTDEGEFAAFINMCAKTNAAKREKPLPSGFAANGGVSLKITEKFFVSSKNFS